MKHIREYEVFDLATLNSHGAFATLSEALGCVAFHRLRAWSIWQGNVLVDSSEPEDLPQAHRQSA